MISHQFVPQDEDDEYCDVQGCDGHIDRHLNLEGITADDEVYDFGQETSDIVGRYVSEFGDF